MDWTERYRQYDERLFKALEPYMNDPASLESKFGQVLLHEPTKWGQIRETLEQFVGLGWDRRKLYEVTRYVQFNNDLPEEKEEYLAEIMRNLTGDCLFERIIRLSNEPQGEEEFSRYFTTLHWGWDV